MLRDPLPDYVLPLLILLFRRVISGLLRVLLVAEEASGVKRAIYGVNIAGAEFRLRQLVEAPLNLLVPSGELHLVGTPPVILLVPLLLLLLPLYQVLRRLEVDLVFLVWLGFDASRLICEVVVFRGLLHVHGFEGVGWRQLVCVVGDDHWLG